MKHKITYLLLTLTGAFMPFLMGSLLLGIVQQTTFQSIHLQVEDSLPTWHPEFADEILHWKQAMSFHAAGLNSGYYTRNEVPARLELSHFYAWGPFPSILYGSFAHIFGNSYTLFIKVNTLLFSIAFFILVYLTKPDVKQLILLNLLFAFFPTIILYFPTFMLQMLNLIFAVIVAAISYFVIRKGEKVSYRELTLVLLTLLGISLFRFTWAFSFFPILIYLGSVKYGIRGQRIGFIISAFLLFSSFIIVTLLSAPYPNILTNVLAQGSNIGGIIAIMSRHIFVNFVAYFIGSVTMMAIRLPVLLILNIYIFPYYQKFRGQAINLSSKIQIETLFTLGHLGLILLFAIVVYSVEAWRDIRLIAPHLLVVIILFILFKHYRLSIILLSAFVLVFPFVLNSYRDGTTLHFSEYDESTRISYQSEYNTHGIVYDSTVNNAWCNTVLYHISYNNYTEMLLAFDNRLGLSLFFRTYHIKSDLKSRYIILPSNTEPLDDWELQPLMSVEDGYIYLNLNANCDSSE